VKAPAVFASTRLRDPTRCACRHGRISKSVQRSIAPPLRAEPKQQIRSRPPAQGHKTGLYIFVQICRIVRGRTMSLIVYAVVIADVVESGARQDLRSVLSKRLSLASRNHLKRRIIRLPYSVTAGDEFQTILSDPSKVPELIMDLRSTIRPLRLQIGIGFGSVSGRIQQPVNRLGGEAFRFARTALEGIKSGADHKFQVLTAFRSRNAKFDSTLNLIYGLHDTLLLKVTPKQWEAIEAFRAKHGLAGAAKALHLDVSTVSRNLKRGFNWQLDETMKVMSQLIRSAEL
jgi:SatD family (SatD)